MEDRALFDAWLLMLESDTLVDGFTYDQPPTIASVTPDNGPPAGGTPFARLSNNSVLPNVAYKNFFLE